jgi:hypothetical protein
MNKWWYKIGFYLLSMVFFLIIVMILGTKIPFYFGDDWVFLGWKALCLKGVLIPIICSLLILVSFFFCWWLYKWNKGSRLGTVTETKYENVSGDVMSFVASYFFPLVSFNIGTTWRHVAVLGVLFVIIGLIYIKSNIYYCNPTLHIFGFRAYKTTGKVGKEDLPGDRYVAANYRANESRIKYV